MARLRGSLVAAATAATVVLACIFPTDRSADVSVALDSVPALFLKDTFQLAARLLDEAGAAVPAAAIRYASSDVTVASVDSTGQLLAVGVGSASVTATAVAFADAQPASRAVQVRGLLEVDSIRPTVARFGAPLTLYGVGLNPDSLFSVTLSGVDAPVAAYVPADPDQPHRLGALSVWVVPPAERKSEVAVLGFKGGLLFPDLQEVLQQDIYEPNDTVPWWLGDLPAGLFNPGLAFETRGRDDKRLTTDWYRFANGTAQDRTIIIGGEQIGVETFSVFVTDSLFWWDPAQTFLIGSQSWTIGPETYFCGGLAMTDAGVETHPLELQFPVSIVALQGLPAGEYHALAVYNPQPSPRAYRMVVANQYISVLPPDAMEENDFCDLAKPLSAAVAAGTLTIDNPHDIEWYEFALAVPQVVTVTVAATDTLADLDLYLVEDARPDSLPLRGLALASGQADTVSALLEAGRYFLVVADYPGEPTTYRLGTAFAAPPLGAPVAPAITAELQEQLDRKRAVSGAAAPAALRPRPRR